MTSEENTFYLVRYEDNWADEFDIHGSTIIDQRQYDFLNQVIDNTTYFQYCFGSNEDIEYNSPSEIRSTLTFEEITFREMVTLHKFGFGEFGEAFVDGVVESYVDYMEPGEYELIKTESDYYFMTSFAKNNN